MSQPSPQESDPLVGQVIAGQYVVEGLVARGGMGNIYRARQQRLGRAYAVKVLRKEFCEDAKVVKRFMREALAVSQLRHPHTVQVYDTGETPDGFHYIVMEYLEGTSLDRRILADNRLDAETAVRFMSQAASALAEAHKKGIVHRDLKPANLFIVELDEVPDFIKILDFGVAKFYTGRGGGKELTKLTAAGSTMGTPHYMAPEQIRGEDVDGRADIYSLGIILWECLVGFPPYNGDSPMEIFLGHLEQPLPPASSAVEGPLTVPPPVDAVIARATTKNANERFATMGEFRQALEGLLMGLDPAAAVISQSLSIPPGLFSSGSLPVVERNNSQPSQSAPTAPDGPAHTTESRDNRTLLLVAMAALLVVGVIGLSLYFAGDSNEGERAGAVEAAPAHLKVYSEPGGAEVIVDGEIIGRTPVRLDAPVGEGIDVELRAPGYEPIALNLTPAAEEVNGAIVVLRPERHAGDDALGGSVSIWVESDPSGAAIVQDGNETGLVTPVSLRIPVRQDTMTQVDLVRDGFLTERYSVLARGSASMVLSSTLIPE